MIVPTAEGSGTVVLSSPASSNKDEMTIGGSYVIDGIDVVATLIPEEDVWQFEATETCTTETQMQDREQESIAMEAIEAYDARTGEKLDSEEVRQGQLMNSKSKWRSMNQKRDRHQARKSDQNAYNTAIRCRLCATEVNTGESRSDTFAATPPLKFVRLELQAQASKRVDDHRCVSHFGCVLPW